MASITSPALSNAIRTDVPAINAILKALAKSDPSTLTDIENGTKRIVALNGKWNFQELVDGSWVTRTLFNIDAVSLDGKTVSVDATANTIPVRGTDGKLAGDITGNADTATKATALASTLAVPGGGTGGTTAAAARTNLDVPPTSHASTTTTYGVSSNTQYGHSIATSTTPKALGAEAVIGSETASFARGDHVHPITIATSTVTGSVKLSDSTSSTSAASAGIAASPKAVKTAYDKASTAQTTADSALAAAGSAASAASKAQTTADSALAAAEAAKDTAANITIPVTSVNGMTGAVTVGTVRTVNGTSADAAGNVTLNLFTGAVAQKLSTTVTTTTKTVSGLTPYKPVFIALKKTAPSNMVNALYAWVSSGTDINATSKGDFMVSYGAGQTYWGVIIPNGTSISIVCTSTGSDVSGVLVVYQ